MGRRKKGLSLIELIIYIGLVAAVMLVMIDLTTRLVFSQAKSSDVAELSQNLELAVSRLQNSIENATALNGTYPADTLDLIVGGQNITYTLSGHTLMVQPAGQNAILLTSSKVKISSYPADGKIFQKLTNGSATTIKINLTAALSSDPKVKEDLSTSFLMRGK